MIQRTSRNEIRTRVHDRIRGRVRGTAERPRLAIYRSLKHIYAQVIDDSRGRTLVSASSNEKNAPANGGNLAGAKEVGKLIAGRAKTKGILKVVFDGVSDAVDYQAREMADRYWRFQEDRVNQEMDDASPDAVRQLLSAADGLVASRRADLDEVARVLRSNLAPIGPVAEGRPS